MARSQQEKARTHERIVGIAARRMREAGLQGVGVADVMKEAGLTVGGFYKHFESRDALVAEAMAATFGVWEARGEALSWPGLRDEYLSAAHCANPGAGCTFGALAPDLARADPATREIATAQLGRNVETLARLLGEAEGKPARARAILAFSAMVGAVGLARLSTDAALAEEILETVKEMLG